eukprot:57591-Chlamydomonas_euryale.AAC.1
MRPLVGTGDGPGEQQVVGDRRRRGAGLHQVEEGRRGRLGGDARGVELVEQAGEFCAVVCQRGRQARVDEAERVVRRSEHLPGLDED